MLFLRQLPTHQACLVCSRSTSRAVLPEQCAAAVVPAGFSHAQHPKLCVLVGIYCVAQPEGLVAVAEGFAQGNVFFCLRKMFSAFCTSFWIAFVFCDLNWNHAAVLLFLCSSLLQLSERNSSANSQPYALYTHTHTQIFWVAFVAVPCRWIIQKWALKSRSCSFIQSILEMLRD